MAEMSANVRLVNLTTRQRAAVELLATAPGMSNVEIAAAVGVSERTLRRWLATPTFGDAVDHERRRALRDQVRRFPALAQKAIDLLFMLLDRHEETAKASWATRARATQIALNVVVDHMRDDLLGRVEALERGR